MQWRELFCGGRINIAKDQHVFEAIFAPALVSVASFKSLRVFNVPKSMMDLICSRNSGVFSCPWAETACCTAAVTQELNGVISDGFTEEGRAEHGPVKPHW